jgi:hypothetical protein
MDRPLPEWIVHAITIPIWLLLLVPVVLKWGIIKWWRHRPWGPNGV